MAFNLFRYLDEQVFRYNNRQVKTKGQGGEGASLEFKMP